MPDAATSSTPLGAEFIVLMILLGGLQKCSKLLKEEGRSKTCVVSLMLFLIGMVVMTLPTIALRMVGPVPDFALGCLVLTFALLIASIVLAIIGLIEIRKSGGALTLGRGQAVWGLVVSALVLVLVTSLLFSAVGARMGRRSAGVANVQGLTPANVVTRVDEFNFQVRSLPTGWSRFDAKSVNPDAAVGFVQRRPERYFIVIAEEFDPRLGIGDEQLVAAVRLRLQQVASELSMGDPAPFEIDGMVGQRFESEARVGSVRLSYVHWVHVHNGFAYQLLIWSGRGDGNALRQGAGEILGQFALIDRSRVAKAAEDTGQPLGDYRADAFGLGLDLEGSGWRHGADEEAFFDDAALTGRRDLSSGFAVFPIDLQGTDPAPEALEAALLSRAFPESDSYRITDRQSITEAGMRGSLLRIDEAVDDQPYVNRAKLLVGDGRALLVVAYEADTGQPEHAAVDDLLSRVRIFEPAGAPEHDDRSHRLHARVFNNIGLYYYRADVFGRAGDYFVLAHRHRADDPVYLNNVIEAFARSDRVDEAYALVAPQIDRFPEADGLKANYAWLLAETSRMDDALALYRSLFEKGFRDDEHTGHYLDYLEFAERHAEALELVERLRSENDDYLLIERQGRLLSKLGRHEEAIGLLESQPQPYSPAVLRSLVYRYWDAERHADALKAVDRLIANGFDSADNYYLKGQLLYTVERYADAKGAFELARERAPHDAEIADAIQAASARLGQGSNSLAKADIDPVELPPRFAWDPGRAAAAQPLDDSWSARYLHRSKAIHFESGKDFRVTDTLVVQVADASGVERFSTVSQTFDPVAEEISVNRVEVFDAKGELVARGDVSNAYILDDTDDSVVSDDKVLHVPVPGLAPGHRLEVVWTRRLAAAPERFPFRREYFSRSLPVDDAILYVEGDVDRLAWSGPQSLEPQRGRFKGHGALLWRTQRPRVYRWEPHMSPLDHFTPVVALGDRTARWDALVEEYLKRVADRLPVEPETRQLALEVAGEVPDADTRIRALARSVQSRLTYKGLEFGSRGRVMDHGSEILQNRYGDCKDHSLLLWQMLRASGIPAHLALVSMGEDVIESLPSLDQFDHMVVYVPDERGGQVLDATDKDYEIGSMVALGLADKKLLLLDPASPRFVTVPSYPDDSNRIFSRRRIRFRDQTMQVVERLTLPGYYGSFMRGHLRDTPPRDRRAIVQGILEEVAPSLHLSRLEIEGLDDPAAPLVLELGYEFPDHLRGAGQRMNARLESPWEVYYTRSDRVAERTTPFAFDMPVAFDSRVRVEVPEGFSPSEIAEETGSRGKAVAWNLEAKRQPDGVDLHFRYFRPSGEYPANQYDAYQRELAQMYRAMSTDIVFQPSAGESATPASLRH